MLRKGGWENKLEFIYVSFEWHQEEKVGTHSFSLETSILFCFVLFFGLSLEECGEEVDEVVCK